MKRQVIKLFTIEKIKKVYEDGDFMGLIKATIRFLHEVLLYYILRIKREDFQVSPIYRIFFSLLGFLLISYSYHSKCINTILDGNGGSPLQDFMSCMCILGQGVSVD